MFVWVLSLRRTDLSSALEGYIAKAVKLSKKAWVSERSEYQGERALGNNAGEECQTEGDGVGCAGASLEG